MSNCSCNKKTTAYDVLERISENIEDAQCYVESGGFMKLKVAGYTFTGDWRGSSVLDDVVKDSDIPVKTDYMKAIAAAVSRDSSITTCVENLKCDMTTVFQQMNALKYAIESIKNKEKRNGF